MQPECRLRGRADPLERCHVFPEFRYQLVYDEKHRFEEVQFRPDGRVDPARTFTGLRSAERSSSAT
jgi:hypothetical protein